jgi:hypothetical protein
MNEFENCLYNFCGNLLLVLFCSTMCFGDQNITENTGIIGEEVKTCFEADTTSTETCAERASNYFNGAAMGSDKALESVLQCAMDQHCSSLSIGSCSDPFANVPGCECVEPETHPHVFVSSGVNPDSIDKGKIGCLNMDFPEAQINMPLRFQFQCEDIHIQY